MALEGGGPPDRQARIEGSVALAVTKVAPPFRASHAGEGGGPPQGVVSRWARHDLVFENRLGEVQIQEILRAERSNDEAQRREELAAFNGMSSGAGGARARCRHAPSSSRRGREDQGAQLSRLTGLGTTWARGRRRARSRRVEGGATTGSDRRRCPVHPVPVPDLAAFQKGPRPWPCPPATRTGRSCRTRSPSLAQDILPETVMQRQKSDPGSLSQGSRLAEHCGTAECR